MLVSRISPAPRSTPSRAHSHRVAPGLRAPAVHEHLVARRPRAARASMASTTHWAPNTSASSPEQLGPRHRRRVHRHLVGPGVEHGLGVLDRADAAADRERDEHVVGAAPGQLGHGLAPLVRGGDVEEDDLVGALVLVARGQLDRVAGVADVHELDALDHAALVHVEAGDHALEQHQLRRQRGVALGHREAPLVERLAGDHAGQVHEPQVRAAPSGRRPSRCRPSRGSAPARASDTRRTSSRSGPSSIPSRSTFV